MTRRLRIISFLIAMACFALAAGISYLGFEVWPLSATLADGRSVLFPPADVDVCIRARGLAWLGDRSGDAQWRACIDWLTRYQALTGFELRFWSVIGSSLAGLVALLGFALSVRLDTVSLKVLRGARLQAGSRGLRAFARTAAAECRVHGEGIPLVPSIPLGREREARHFLIVGRVGGGKTQTMLHLLNETLSRGDGLLVLDTKGDMMGGLPALGDPLLVAPHDRRSLVWDLAADCSIKQDARELAARFIPASSDPMWSEAAQEIFVACLVHLQATRGKDWSWGDLEPAAIHTPCHGFTPSVKCYNITFVNPVAPSRGRTAVFTTLLLAHRTSDERSPSGGVELYERPCANHDVTNSLAPRIP
jgi:Type IV secretion-system coupling protein DNA-binding domain